MVTKTKTPPVAAGGVPTKDEKLMQNLSSNTMTAVDVNLLAPMALVRSKGSDLLGGLISAGRLANLDCLGQGPGGRITLGRKVGYLRAPFISWLKSRGGLADTGQEEV